MSIRGHGQKQNEQFPNTVKNLFLFTSLKLNYTINNTQIECALVVFTANNVNSTSLNNWFHSNSLCISVSFQILRSFIFQNTLLTYAKTKHTEPKEKDSLLKLADNGQCKLCIYALNIY